MGRGEREGCKVAFQEEEEEPESFIEAPDEFHLQLLLEYRSLGSFCSG
jgi:hypothetical protein